MGKSLSYTWCSIMSAGPLVKRGSYWLVGNENLSSTWESQRVSPPWMSRPINLKPINLNVQFVHELIDI